MRTKAATAAKRRRRPVGIPTTLVFLVLSSCASPSLTEAPATGTLSDQPTEAGSATADQVGVERPVTGTLSDQPAEASDPSTSLPGSAETLTLSLTSMVGNGRNATDRPEPSSTVASPSATGTETGAATVGRPPSSSTTGVHRVTDRTSQPPPGSTTAAPAPTAQVPVEETPPEPDPPSGLVVLDLFAHDPHAFTQGLVFHDGLFYESTGLYGRSSVRIVDPTGGEVLTSVDLGSDYFGEGLEVVDDQVVQLTWKEGTAFVWDARTLEPLGTYTYGGEGWGLCAFADRFVMSDGSSTLTFRDLDTFEVVGEIEVLLEGEPVDRLNELECVDDLVYANVWYSDDIMVIDRETGQVVARIDGSPLREHLSSTEGIDVLNGIAYDPARRVFFLTGKLWPEIFEIRIVTTS